MRHCVWCGKDVEKLRRVDTDTSQVEVCEDCIKEYSSWITYIWDDEQ